MESVTHIALGACIGEAAFSKQIGKKALILGAIAQSLPDADITASLWSSRLKICCFTVDSLTPSSLV
jgi:inner membrane protein